MFPKFEILLLLASVALSAPSIELEGDWKSYNVGRDLNSPSEPPNPAPPGYEMYITPNTLPSPNISQSSNPYLEKAKKFVFQLTVPELVNLTTGTGIENRCVGNTGTIPRLGFKGICLEDSPLGVRFADFTSAFPAAINSAATFDKKLMRARGSAMGAEHKGKGINVALGPMMNLLRAPEAGRLWEGSAESFLSGVASYEGIMGMQEHVMACAKHLINNEQEHYRGGSGDTAESSNVGDRTQHELYLWPFAESIRANVASIMCSYNTINQTSACENSKVMNGLVKEELKFEGFIVSDWGAQNNGSLSALAGLDMSMPGFTGYGASNPLIDSNPATSNNSYWGAAMVEMIANGTVPLWRLQDMAIRIMTPYYRMNMDSISYPNVSFSQLTQNTYLKGELVNEHINVMGDHYKLIREIGSASTVILENNGVLPLRTNYTRWGVFGSDAGLPSKGPNFFSDRGGDDGTLAMGWGSGTADFPYLIDPFSAIQQHLRAENPTVLIEGIFDDYAYSAIDKVAAQCDVCLAFVNSDSGEGYITVDGNMGDRNNLTLWHSGEELIRKVTGNCSNTIVVIHSVGPVDMSSFIDNPNISAIVWPGLPGQESGNSLRDVIFGVVNPSGRLPYTIAKNRADYPADILYNVSNTSLALTPQITYTEELLLDYRWFDAKNITPQYEFGYGLSYTSFNYTNLAVAINNVSSRSTPSEGLYDNVGSVSFIVKNSGPLNGHEVSQLYFGFPAHTGEPPKILRGFERTWIQSHGSSPIKIDLRRKDISIWDVIAQAWLVPRGEFKVFVGSSSRNIKLTGTFSQWSENY